MNHFFKLILLICIVFEVSLFASGISFSKEEKEFIKNNPIINFSDVKWEPFAKIEGDKYSGIFQEYYSLLEKRTGLKFNFVKIGDGINFQLVLDALKNKQIDMIDGSGKTLHRESYALFTKPLMQVNFSIISKISNRVSDLEKLGLSKVVVARGSTASEYLKEKFPNKNMIFTDGIEEGIDLILSNKADALVDNIVVLNQTIKQNFSSSNLVIDTIKKDKFNIYTLIRDDFPLLKSILDKAILSISYEELLSINNKLLLATINTPKKIKLKQVTDKLKLSKEELNYLSKRDNITMCVDPNWMPYSSISNGKQIGINKHFISLIQNNINKIIQLVPTDTWTQSLNYLKENRCEIITLTAPTKSRKEYMNFTTPYLDSSIVLATKNGIASVFKLNSLEKKVAIVKNYAIYEIVKKNYPNLDIVQVETLNDGLIKIKDGEVFGVIDSLVSINYYLQKGLFSEIKINAILDEKLNLSIGVNKNDKTLLSIFQKAVLNITEEQKQNIMNQWSMNDYKKEVFNEVLWKVLAVVFILLLFMLYRHYETKEINKELKRKVNEELEKSRNKDKIIFHQNKMISMGQMLENIAHQWRQPLSQINSSILILDQTLKLENIKNSTINKKLDEIESMTNYMSKTIDDFKGFIKKDGDIIKFNLKDIIEKTINIIKGSYCHNNINLIYNVDDNINISGYPNEIQQALIVILNNARDALIENKIKKAEVKISVEKSINFINIYIDDNANGIDKENLEKIFEPYYTTKHQTKGTGLGLYLSKRIIEESMQGQIEVKNIDSGARFIIKLRNNIE